MKKRDVLKIALMGIALGSAVCGCYGSKPTEQKQQENGSSCSGKTSCNGKSKDQSSCSGSSSCGSSNGSQNSSMSKELQQKREAAAKELGNK
jgi:hypothetical protein